MFSVIAKETMRFAEQGSPATPQFIVYKNRTYTVAEASDVEPGTMPTWVAKSAARLDILGILEKSEDKKERSTRSKHKRASE